MDPLRQNDLRQLKLRNKLRFLLYLCWLFLQEKTLLFLKGYGSRGRAHWIGKRRGRRLERPSIALLFVSAMTLLEPREYAVWAAIWGGITALFIPFYSIYFILQRNR